MFYFLIFPFLPLLNSPFLLHHFLLTASTPLNFLTNLLLHLSLSSAFCSYTSPLLLHHASSTTPPLTPLLITLLSFLNILLLNSPLLPPSPSASRPLPFFFLAYPTSTSLPSLFIILLLRLIFVVLLLKLSLLPCNSASTSPLLYHFGSPPLPSFFTSFCFFTSFLLHRIVLLHVLAPSVPFWFHTPPHFLYHPVPCK